MNDQNQTFKLPENSWEFNQGENSFFDRAYRVWKNVIPQVFIDDVLEWSKYINSNEPELLNYVSKPEGLLLLDEWFKRMDCTPMREEWMKKSSEAKEILNTNTYKLRGQLFSYGNEITEIKKEYIKELLELVEEKYGNILDKCDYIFLSGGGSSIFTSGTYMGNTVLVPKSNYEYYNSIGQAMFGLELYKKGKINVE